MGDLICLIIVLLIILILWQQREKTEHFDTYYNHDMAALDVYQNEKLPINTVNQAGLKAKYQWNERDPLGDTVYDKVYDAKIMEKNWVSDPEYAYRDIDTTDLNNVYDTKFAILNKENELSNYKESDMADKNIIQNIINGQKISLAQKQY